MFMAEVQNNEYLLNESLSPPHFKLLSIRCEMKCQSTANEIVLCFEDGQSDPPGLFIFSLISLTAQLHPDCGLYIDLIQTVLNMFTVHLAAVNTG